MTCSTDRFRRRGAGRLSLAICTVLASAGCSSDVSSEHPTPLPLTLSLGLAVSSVAARPGDTIAVMVTASPSGPDPLALLAGALRFDPAALRYVGQPLVGDALVLVGDSGVRHGTLRTLSLRIAGLQPSVADLRFQVLGAGYVKSLAYTLDLAGTADMALTSAARPLPLAVTAAAPGPPPRRLTLNDWAHYFGLDTAEAHLKVQSAGDGTIYGDLTLNGLINGLDVLAVANMAVGNRQLLTDPTKDYVIAGNVFPANLPGLGEVGDPVPPGQEADGSFIINGGDVLIIANESVGNDRPIAGEPIPGRTPRPFRAVVIGDITADRTFYRDTVYELQGSVSVLIGVRLTIQPGTLIEGDETSRGALVIQRGARITAIGTRLEPIVFTCNAAIKAPGCWGGLVLDGFSLLNNDQMGNPVPGCPEKQSIGNSGLYGGCLVQDTSGTLRFVRIEYGGSQPSPGEMAPGLALLGIGTGTTIEYVQVHGSYQDGIFVSGGTVNLRYVASTASGLTGLHWDDGWVGDGQFLYLQQGGAGGDAVRGSNWGPNPNAGPRSAPALYNVTLSGQGGRGLVFENGSGGTVRNAVVLSGLGSGLDVDGTEACDQTGGQTPTLFVESSMFFGNNPDFDTDSDCLDEAAYATAPGAANRVVDPGLIAGTNTLTPDLRPTPGSPATLGFVLPPSNGFFDLTISYVGAVAPANAFGTNAPWYAGWTRGWMGTP